MSFSTILISNRGEIAARVIRTAKSMGARTVAVYSTADRDAPHVALADAATCIGPGPVQASYLSMDAILDAAKRTGAEAIHPGYGFLSENAEFARRVAKEGLTFIGPPPEAIELMGNKRGAKLRMLEAGVPCVPGYSGQDQDDATLEREASRVGFPLMIKAAAGGGGRGMRLVQQASDVADGVRSARAEAESAFGSGELILERAIVRPRHVEIQVFADTHGNAIHLGERDCSVQRRHQKVVEESPSPAVTPQIRQAMGEAAVQAAKACGYVGAGTVEFLLGEDGSFYFLEMNTRLQVEHPVTEMVTGLDLVDWQIRVARGEPLPLDQSSVELTGHAIEVRLYAEDPARGFLPQTGRAVVWEPAANARIDHGLSEGMDISPYYDAMVAKIITHGRDREEARAKLVSALRDTHLFGLVSNKSFLLAILRHPGFAGSDVTTAFIDQHLAGHATMQEGELPNVALATCALVRYLDSARSVASGPGAIGWSSASPVWSVIMLAHGEKEHAVRCMRAGHGEFGPIFALSVDADGAPDTDDALRFELVSIEDREIVVIKDAVRSSIRYAVHDSVIWIDDGDHVVRCTDTTHAPAQSADRAGSGRLTAPMDGKITKVLLDVGAQVSKGAIVALMEAMKMEHRIVADTDGTVSAIGVTEGDQVKTRQLLATIEPAAEGGA